MWEEKDGLVSTACACAIIPQKNLGIYTSQSVCLRTTVASSQVMCTWQPLSMSPIRGSTTKWFLTMLRTMRDVPWCHIRSLPSLLCPKLYRLTPNGVLTAHTEWLPGVWLRHFSTTCAVHIEDCEGCRSSMAEHWLHKPGLLGLIPSLKTPKFSLFTSHNRTPRRS